VGGVLPVDPVAETPTETVDYAVLSAAYATLLGALVLTGRERERDQPLAATELLPLGLATFALSKLLTKEKVESWVREPFVEERPDGERRPKGRGLRYAVGELLNCPRCAGGWGALALVGLRVARPREARMVSTVLGVSATNDFLHTGFSFLCARTNVEQVVAQAPPTPNGGNAPNGSSRRVTAASAA